MPTHDRELAKQYMKNVEQQHFAETGPQAEGTRTVPTQYSLDHYLAQQWNLDLDNLPRSLPDELEKVR